MSEQNTDVVDDEVSLMQALEAEFDKQTTENELPAEAVEVETDNSVTESAEQSAAPEEAPEVVPPEHWSDEDKQAFMAMDESGRDWALRLEANAHKGIEEKSKELKKFRDAFEPFKHLVPEGSEVQAIQQLLNAQAVLQRNPQEGIEWLKRSYGIEQNPTPVQDDDEFIDPEVKKLKEEIAELRHSAEQNLRNAEAQRQQALQAEIVQFRDAVDDNGELSHPHFADVQGVMAGLLQSGKATDMEDAYSQAVWSVPGYRDKVVEQIAKERAEKELAERTAAAQKAEKAAKSVNGKKSAKTSEPPKNMRDALLDNYEKSIRGEL